MDLDKKSPKRSGLLSVTWWKQQARRLWGWSPIRSSDSQADSSSTTISDSEERNSDVETDSNTPEGEERISDVDVSDAVSPI